MALVLPLMMTVMMALVVPGTASASPPAAGTETPASGLGTPAGLPISELVPGSPERYAVRPGDTVLAVASLYVRSPWRWPQLWGASGEPGARVPLLHPGQVLVLARAGDRAHLRLEPAQEDAQTPPTVRLSPRLRVQLLSQPALPTLEPRLIEPFLAEPLLVDDEAFRQAPRIVAAPEGRVLITRGDRAYARGPSGSAVDAGSALGAPLRIFRDARAVRDPADGTVLGHEAHYVGRALLLRSQGPSAQPPALPVPAVLDIVASREEIRVGDRLLPEPPRPSATYAPRAPQAPVEGGRVAAMYGDTVGMAGQNQVVVINRGRAHGLASGHVLALVKSGEPRVDRTASGLPERIQLPDERNGLLMVFRAFERLSYALILETADGVKIGDRVVHPE